MPSQSSHVLRLSFPDFGEDPLEVPSEYQRDLLVAVPSADQALGQVEHPFGMVQALDVDLLAEAVASLIGGAQPLVLLRRHVVVAVEVRVAADPDVLDPDELRDMVE